MAEKTVFDQLNTNVDSYETKVLNAITVNSFQATGPNGEIIFDSTQQTLPGFIADTASLAFTASTAPLYLPLAGGTITGNLTVTGTTTLNNVVTVTSSYSSGSTIFGDALTDTHRFTGSVFITGSSFTWNNNTLIASNVTSSMSVASASQALTASYFNGSVTSASYAATASKIITVNEVDSSATYYPVFANNASGPVSLFADALTYTYQPSTNILTVTSSFALGASGSLTGSLLGTASNALTASYVTPYEGAWISYTPNWTAASSNPVIGNGTIEGWYKVVGKTCFVRGNIAMGSTTTFGSGEWYVSMPFTASHADAILMTANLLDNGSAWYNAVVNGARAGFNYKAPLQYQAVGGTANDVNATQPFTWANSDRFLWNGSFEIA